MLVNDRVCRTNRPPHDGTQTREDRYAMGA